MAINTGSAITPADITNGFVSAVQHVILDSAYDINDVPMDGQTYCIQPERLGNKTSIPAPSIGVVGGSINAVALYDNLCYITTVLTRVGTFSYVRTYQYNNDRQVKFKKTGKAFFTEEYAKTLADVSNPSVSLGQVISASGLNQLFVNLLDAWKRTIKHHNVIENHCCHANCHNNCYSDCHGNCNCYK